MRLLRECIVELVAEAWHEERYKVATAKNLMLDEPGHIVEPDVRTKVFRGLKKMGLVKGKLPHPKGPRRKAIKA